MGHTAKESASYAQRMTEDPNQKIEKYQNVGKHFLLNHRKASLLVCYATSDIINSDHQLDLHNTEQTGERGNKKFK